MGKTTIEWTATVRDDGTVVPGYSFNPWWGCVKVSSGCEHCYAETFSKRVGQNIWGPAKTTQRRLFGDKYWAEPLKWNKAAEAAGERHRVFCASMADVFENHPQVVESRRRLFDLILATPALDWLLLTKRPENILRMLPDKWLYRCSSTEERVDRIPPNIWFGTSVENQEQANERIEHLINVPARIRFLSCEPLLGPIDLKSMGVFAFSGSVLKLPRLIDWVIVGGESGHGARPMHPDWARSLRDQCLTASVPYLFKQWGEWAPVTESEIDHYGLYLGKEQVAPVRGREECGYYCDPAVGHIDHREHLMKRVGKKAAGRLLDGREWSEFPP